MPGNTSHTPPIPLFRSTPTWDGRHTSSEWGRQVDAGRALRVRQGIYLKPEYWAEAAPWTRLRIAIAATAMQRDPLFCRETALILHGAPLLREPKEVSARTLRDNGTGVRRAPTMTGKWRPAASEKAGLWRNIPTRLHHPVRPAGYRRTEALDLRRTGELPLEQTVLGPACNPDVSGPEQYWVEPLPIAVLDTVTRMSFAEGVTVLDWVKRTGIFGPEEHLHYLTTKVMHTRWDALWQFASPRSDSVGESWSRALIHELGFVAPTLQTSLHTDIGTYRGDFCWETARVIGEFDGTAKYFEDRFTKGRDARHVLGAEKEREDAIRRAGWAVVRWTWKDLHDPPRFAARLKKQGVPLR